MWFDFDEHFAADRGKEADRKFLSATIFYNYQRFAWVFVYFVKQFFDGHNV